ncbi:MAG: pyruvate kinase [Thermoguttaceae bacterium]
MPETNIPTYSRPSQTKIVATIGPACAGQDRLVELASAGVDVFRINMAHGDLTQHAATLAAVRGVAEQVGRPLAVLMDLAGPKIRLRELPDGQITCDADDTYRFVRGHEAKAPNELTTTYEPLVDELAVGNSIMLADGTVSMVVEQLGNDFAQCRVVQPGLIRSRQGVNLPGAKLSAPALGPADLENAVWGAANGVDFVGLSFVRSPEEIRQLRALLDSHGSGAHVIAKIEKPEALERIDEIVEAADGVMVARGDLGVEIDIARVAVAQKDIIAESNRQRKPVIIATQMLDSMQHSRLPTRAEVADVSNAILDGADACMLSGETAIGKYPRESVEMMHRIAVATEPLCKDRPAALLPDFDDDPNFDSDNVNQITEATVFAAGRMAEELKAEMVVVASGSGATALALSKDQLYVPVIGVSDSAETLRRMCLYWGVVPLPGAPTGDSAALLEHITKWGRASGILDSGDRIVLIAGTGLAVTAHNMIVVHEIE